MIIYLEGPDGSGKSTLAEHITEMLMNSGYKVCENANQLVPTHPKGEYRLNEKQLFAKLKQMAKDRKWIYIVDRCMISDYVYRVFDDYTAVTTLSKMVQFLKQYGTDILLIYCCNKDAERHMLERGDENPIAIAKHKEITKVFNIVMEAVAPVMPYTFIKYDFSKRKAINEVLGKIAYYVYLKDGGVNE